MVKSFLIGVGVVLLLVALIVLPIGIWHLNWFVKEKNVGREVNLRNTNVGTQTAWHDEAIELLTEIEQLPEGHPSADLNQRQGCQLIARLTDTYRDDIIVELEEQYC